MFSLYYVLFVFFLFIKVIFLFFPFQKFLGVHGHLSGLFSVSNDPRSERDPARIASTVSGTFKTD